MLSRTKRGLLLTVLGTTCLFISVGYATWVNTYIKVENNDVPPIKKYTVKFYDQNSHLLGNYTISGLEIDSIIELPYLEDNEKYDFVGWKENHLLYLVFFVPFFLIFKSVMFLAGFL